MNNLLGNIRDWGRGLWPRFRKFWWSDWFDPRKSFLMLPSFWGPFTLIVLLSLTAFLKVKIDENLVFDIGGSLTKWYQWYQVPIWIFALLIPVIGLFNANHKSEQTKAQMELTRSQNNFANYYKHLEEFSKLCRCLEQDKYYPGLKIDERNLHKFLFLEIRSGDPKIPKIVLERVQNISESADKLVKELEAAVVSSARLPINAHETHITHQMVMINARLTSYINFDYEVFSKKITSNNALKIIDLPLFHLIMMIRNQVDVMKKCMEFDPEFDPVIFDSLEEMRYAIARITCYKLDCD